MWKEEAKTRSGGKKKALAKKRPAKKIEKKDEPKLEKKRIKKQEPPRPVRNKAAIGKTPAAGRPGAARR